MNYLVLARKYRPQSFTELIGQEHISDLLSKAIKSNRISQAYLFTGPRGVGKTSCARILAKSLNCEKGPTLTPCNKCSACVEITKGTSFDVLEVDGASNRGIDEIRTLRENVKFAPSYGRFKIYIVDEVHMLTTEAFNALLKTLEEPPEHVKFIFATTSVQKVPATIISRCQRFDFVRIPLKTNVDLLASIAAQEKINIDQEALYAIAKASQGSLRDALSILDQVSALSEQTIKAEDVCSMLGLVEIALLFDLSQNLIAKDCAAALTSLEKILSKGKDVKQLMKDLTEHFRNLMIIKIGGKTLGRLVDYPVNIKEQYLAQSLNINLSEILKAIDILIEAQETARITESIQMALEIALAKIAYVSEKTLNYSLASTTVAQSSAPVSPRPQVQSVAPKQTQSPQSFAPVNILKDNKGEIPTGLSAGTKELVVERDEEEKEDLELKGEVDYAFMDLEKFKTNWDALTFAVSREKMSVASYLQEGVPLELKGEILVVGFPKSLNFHKEALEDSNNKRLIERIFSEKLNAKVVLAFKTLDIIEPKNEEPMIQKAIDSLNGKVVNRWHNE